MAENFIKDGLKKANENILNIKPPNLKISSDNSKAAVEYYLAEIQKILNDNLKDWRFSIINFRRNPEK